VIGFKLKVEFFVEEVLKTQKLSLEQKLQISIDVARGINFLQVRIRLLTQVYELVE
jgi:hypothetical protein